jgi:hypothetical protein
VFVLGLLRSNSGGVSVAKHWEVVCRKLPIGLRGAAVAGEECTIVSHRHVTGQSRKPSQLWLPADYGRTSRYRRTKLRKRGLITGHLLGPLLRGWRAEYTQLEESAS